MSIEVAFTKQNLELYLKELAKEFKKRGHGTHAEMILVGGASVIINYDFRVSSYDIDAWYDCPTVMKESIRAVADRFGLQDGWLNDDFKKTASYTYKIREHSVYYRTFSNVLEVRTIRAEYLVAMKLVSGRQYKKDLSDVAGIVYAQKKAGQPLDRASIDRAVTALYGDWSQVSAHAVRLLDSILTCDDLEQLLAELHADEASARAALAQAIQSEPEAVRADNVDDIIAAALQKKQQK